MGWCLIPFVNAINRKGLKMKLVATTEKVQIKWFVYAGNDKIPHTSAHAGDWGYDVECSCGWKTRTGGATRTYVTEEVIWHKRFDHGYKAAN